MTDNALPPRAEARPRVPDLTAQEIKDLWAANQGRPDSEVITVTLRDGQPHPILIGWLRYAHEYVAQLGQGVN